MASLQVRNPDFSGTRQKAREDAKKMQAIVEEDCIKAGKEVPPYLLQELIGKGNYGRVYKATDLKSKLVAVKIINIEEGDTHNPKLADTYSEFMKEFSALKLLSESGAKNINLTLDALPVGQAMWMVTEYCAGGSVATLMKPTAPGGLQEKWIIPIVRELAEAIYWVHKEGIIHRDIKCANVLVTETGSVQLCDFGVAGIVESKIDKRTTFIGTLHWMAPELFDHNPSYSTPVDIWAFGSLVYEIASGLPPNVMAGFNIPQLGQYIKHHAPRLEGDYSDQIKDLVAFCLIEDPAKRPTIQQIQQHPYIRNTSEAYPTAGLANLVKAYKLWEGQGGIRRSLFAPFGSQGPSDSDPLATAQVNDEWNFSTTVDFDRQIMNTDAQALYDVYGMNVDFEYNDKTSRPAKPKPRRRMPPQLQPLKAPLEKLFDPNTISNYEENSRVYYGRAPPPPPSTAAPSTTTTSDLPLRDDSQHSTLRESLIDLDASLHRESVIDLDASNLDASNLDASNLDASNNRESLIDLDASLHDGGDLSQFVDMATIRAGMRVPSDSDNDDETDYSHLPFTDPADNLNRRTVEWKFPTINTSMPIPSDPDVDDATDYNKPPLSDPADNLNRRTQQWKFPTMAPPASANPEMSRFPFHEEQPPQQRSESSMSGRPPLMLHHPHHPAEDSGVGLLAAPEPYDNRPPSQQDNRISVGSLIDLDEGLPMPELARPSTANSDVASVAGSDIGGANPFDLERRATLYAPSNFGGIREPSIYVSDDSDLARLATAVEEGEDSPQTAVQDFAGPNGNNGSQSTTHSRAGSYDDDIYPPSEYDAEYLTMGMGAGMGMGMGSMNMSGMNLSGRRSRARAQSGASTASGGGTQLHLQQHPPRASSSSPAARAMNGMGMGINMNMNMGMGMGMDRMMDSGAESDMDSTVMSGGNVGPPSVRVMQGSAGREQVRDEVMRLLASFSEQLGETNAYVSGLPVRAGRRGSEAFAAS